jgi:alcohol dehydrogenase class IV
MRHEFYIGASAISYMQHILEQLQVKHVFLVRGKKSYIHCGAADKLQTVWSNIHCQVTEFDDFSTNPKEEDTLKGTACFNATHADCIIAVGGGSAMDMAKLIRYQAMQTSTNYIPLFAVPTTAGTGAEATKFAVVYRNGIKHSVEDEHILPDYAIVYPSFTYSNSPYLTACTGIDALAQAIEAFWSKNATAESKEFAIKAIQLLWQQLPQLVHNSTPQLRDEVAEGAYWAGRAINITKTTAPHAYSYAFTSDYGYPHGHAVALTLPFFLLLNGNDELYALLQTSKDTCMSDMEAYLQKINIDCKLQNIDIDAVLSKVNIQRLANNPINITNEINQQLKAYLSTIR